mgnify:CR=1 FL=1
MKSLISRGGAMARGRRSVSRAVRRCGTLRYRTLRRCGTKPCGYKLRLMISTW